MILENIFLHLRNFIHYSDQMEPASMELFTIGKSEYLQSPTNCFLAAIERLANPARTHA